MIKKLLLLISLFPLYQGAYLLLSNKFFLPSLSQISISFIDNFSHGDIYQDIFQSLMRVSVGFFFASIIGILLGLFLADNTRLRNLKIYIDLLKPIPPIAWIPIAILLFGLGNNSSYFIVFLGAFFPIFTNTYFGGVSIPQIYKNVASSFEMGKISYFYKILFFFTLPYIFTGLKIGLGMAWMSVIAAELINAQSGLGYFIQLNRLLLRTENIILGMFLIGLIGFALQKCVEFVEKKITKWT